LDGTARGQRRLIDHGADALAQLGSDLIQGNPNRREGGSRRLVAAGIRLGGGGARGAPPRRHAPPRAPRAAGGPPGAPAAGGGGEGTARHAASGTCADTRIIIEKRDDPT